MTTTAAAPRFRPLDADDRDVALALMRAYYAEDGHRFDPDLAAEALNQIAAGTAAARFWLIEQDAHAAGYLCITLGFSLEVGGGDFFLDEIYITPEARGGGLGHTALAFAEQQAAALGAHRICLEVERHNDRARALYERSGYRSHARHLMSKPLTPRR